MIIIRGYARGSVAAAGELHHIARTTEPVILQALSC
jgi:hypothetical protein